VVSACSTCKQTFVPQPWRTILVCSNGFWWRDAVHAANNHLKPCDVCLAVARPVMRCVVALQCESCYNLHMSTSSSVSFDTYERGSAALSCPEGPQGSDSEDWEAVLSDWAEVGQ
jgi:hypothetical protein